MSCKAFRSQEFFEIVRETDGVKLDDAIVQVNSGRVHVTMHNSLLVEVG